MALLLVAPVLMFALEMSSSQCRLFLVGTATVVVTTVSHLGGARLLTRSCLLQGQVLLVNLLVPMLRHALGARLIFSISRMIEWTLCAMTYLCKKLFGGYKLYFAYAIKLNHDLIALIKPQDRQLSCQLRSPRISDSVH
jgi:hypothetical protein